MGGIENRVAALRQERGLSAADLAALVDVTRQTIYAVENGSYVPNTAVALKLARALQTTVENLFALPDEPVRNTAFTWLSGVEPSLDGQPVQLCEVDGKLIATAPASVPWQFPTADAVVAGSAGVQLFEAKARFDTRLLVAGCDPGMSVLARHASSAGVDLVLTHRNSSQSLELLKLGHVHIAGTHLRDDMSGESNLPAIDRMFPKRSVAVITFAVWEEGIVAAAGNPKNISGVEDFARRGIRIVNRESGAGSRNLLDSRLRKAGIEASRVKGYDRFAAGHLAAAWEVHAGAADCCIATAAAARVFGLHFIPLVTERYDLAIRKKHLGSPMMQSLLDTLNRSAFRRELAGIGGYDTRLAGQRLL